MGMLYIGIAFLVWFGAVYYMFRMVALRKPGVNIWLDTFFNPFNLILMSSKLTEGGIKAHFDYFGRRFYLYGAVSSITCTYRIIEHTTGCS